MSAYGAFAAWYDALTRDVDYAAFADFYEQCFQQGRGESHTLLDFCCGTGTLTRLMAARGYEMIATDGSPDMLMQAQAHNAELPPDAVAPLLLCQEASELDLYGTVDAAYCSLDGIDYLPPEELPEVLHRLHLFVRPGGMLILDIRDPASFRALDGGTFVDETDDVLCLWRAEFDAAAHARAAHAAAHGGGLSRCDRPARRSAGGCRARVPHGDAQSGIRQRNHGKHKPCWIIFRGEHYG